jgi:hypothetical protein
LHLQTNPPDYSTNYKYNFISAGVKYGHKKKRPQPGRFSIL